MSDILRQPAEIRFREELDHLAACDEFARPAGWLLSPRAVRSFILGTTGEPTPTKKASKKPAKKPAKKLATKAAQRTANRNSDFAVSRKFHGDDALVDRAIVTLMSNRGLILVGEPGTAKSMLSELLAAAISGTSQLTIQGTAGTTEDQIKYSWNYALLLAEGPSQKAMVPAPLHRGLAQGLIVRFEEITRCPPEIQDTVISVLSDKVLQVPELEGDQSSVFAKPGFNLIATANTRDRGVHEMSSALKRRFNFETVHPIGDKTFELELVIEQARQLLDESAAEVQMTEDVVDVLVTTFHELRQGRTQEGGVLETPSSVMSTAEAVAVAFAAGLDACHFGDGVLTSTHVARQLIGTVFKDAEDDVKKIRHYFDVVVKARANRSEAWKEFYDARSHLV